MSATQSWFVRSAVKFRSTRSGAGRASRSRRVVMTPRRRLTPTIPGDVLGHEQARLGCFSLTGIDAVPPREIKALNEKSPGLGLDTDSVERRSSAVQEAALIGPVGRQIEFGETGRSEFDGLPALQDRLDQL